MSSPRTRNPVTDTDRLARGLELLGEAQEHLTVIDLRRYRGKTAVREAVQESRLCVEASVEALHEAIELDASSARA